MRRPRPATRRSIISKSWVSASITAVMLAPPSGVCSEEHRHHSSWLQALSMVDRWGSPSWNSRRSAISRWTISSDPECDSSSSGSTLVCGPPPPTPISPGQGTASTRRCTWRGSPIGCLIRPPGSTSAARQHLLDRGVGVTNLVNRATVRADELSSAELQEGAVIARPRWWRRGGPRVAAVLGVTAYRIGFSRPRAVAGRQPESLGGSRPVRVGQPERAQCPRDGGFAGAFLQGRC